MPKVLEKLTKKVVSQIVGSPISVAIDILVIAIVIYLVLLLLRRNNALGLAKYIFVYFVAGLLIRHLDTGLLLTELIFEQYLLISILAVLVIFPKEIRRMLWKISSPRSEADTYNEYYDCTDEELLQGINEIVRSTQNMAKKNVGALIVIVPNTIASQIVESGTELNAKLSGSLLESIFITKGPLHDGAVIVKGNRIISAGCFLPLSEGIDLPRELGTRHRAAIGVTENTNVLTIICSEQTGVISVARNGQLKRYYDSTMLSDTLQQIYGLKASTSPKKKGRKIRR